MVQTSDPSPEPAVGSGSLRSPVWRRPRFWLAFMVASFVVVSVYAGAVAYANFQTENSTDAGIITQAVASTAHGGVAPFYESYDCQVKDRCSFLLVHPGFILYLAVPFYLLAPSTVTLFALRSLVVGLAAVPLYWLTRQVTGSPQKGLLAAGLWLFWAPQFAADAFSLHLESLLPVELLSLAALWQAGRFRWGLVAATATFLTFEIAPLFTFLIGLFFLFPYVDARFRAEWRRWRDPIRSDLGVRATLRRWGSGVRSLLRVTEVRYIVLLLGISAMAYTALSLFTNVFGYAVLGVASPPPLGTGLSGIFANNATPATQSLSTILSSAQTLRSAEYWLVLYGLLGFLPLLSPRSLIVSVPWIGWTLLTDSSRFTTLGHQYAMVAAAPLFIGLAYGLRRINFGWSRRAPRLRAELASRPAPRAESGWSLDPPSRRLLWGTLFGSVLLANALLMPVDPVLSDAGVVLGAPFAPAYFDHSLTVSPAFPWVEQLIATIPYEASIAAPSAIFPIVANFPHAYVLVPAGRMNTTNLPINLTGGVDFALVTPASFSTLGSNVSRNVSNPALYGVRGWVASTTLGPLILYERGFTGSAQLFGPSPGVTAGRYAPGRGIGVGPKGRVVLNASSPTGLAVESLNVSDPVGQVWTGPNVFLSPGNYTIGALVAVSGANVTLHPDEISVKILGEGVGAVLVNASFSNSEFVPGAWTELEFNVTVLAPTPNFDLKGFLQTGMVGLAVSETWIEPFGV